MHAVQYDAPRGPLVLRRVPVPACPPDGVLVRVRATGVCRSDWHAWQGHDPVALPHVPGHEFAGEVAAVGADVTRWRAGDRVTAPFVLGCGRCAFCRDGDPQVCPDQQQPGFTYPGSFAEHVAVPAADFNLVALPDALDFGAAAALGCRFATAYRALTHHGRLRAGQDVAVFGCGGVGLSAVLIARALGARVVAVDVSPAALDRARDLGAAETVLVPADADPAEVAAAVRAHTAGGAHLTLDAIGSPATVRAAVLSLRRRGTHVQVGLLFGDDAAPPVPLDRALAWELTVVGSHGIAAHEYPAMFDLIATAAIPLHELVGASVPLSGAGAALAAMSRARDRPRHDRGPPRRRRLTLRAGQAFSGADSARSSSSRSSRAPRGVRGSEVRSRRSARRSRPGGRRARR